MQAATAVASATMTPLDTEVSGNKLLELVAKVWFFTFSFFEFSFVSIFSVYLAFRSCWVLRCQQGLAAERDEASRGVSSGGLFDSVAGVPTGYGSGILPTSSIDFR